jgi:hypothetical protein
MHSEIEKLIDLALADGQVTEKERNVILKKAAELGVDTDEVEMVLDGRLHQLEASKPKEKEKIGNIKTCPACGASVKAFQVKCDDCGHEFTNSQALTSKQKLFSEFEKVEIEERNRSLNFTEKLDAERVYDRKINARKASIVSTFPLPYNKEDLLDFFNLAIHESKKYGSVHDDGVLRLAWKSKANELKAKISLELKDDIHAKLLLLEYNHQNKTISISPKQKMLIAILALFIFLFLAGYFGLKSENEGERNEISKLNNIEKQIIENIDKQNYNKALILTEQLVWSYKLEINSYQKKAETYENKRESYKKTILELKNENK